MSRSRVKRNTIFFQLIWQLIGILGLSKVNCEEVCFRESALAYFGGDNRHNFILEKSSPSQKYLFVSTHELLSVNFPLRFIITAECGIRYIRQKITMADCGCEIEIKNREESKVLKLLLSINAFMFVLEIVFGILSQSTALIADSLDMLADATVYGIGLYAVGKSAIVKINAAHLSGIFQVILGLLVIADIVRRFVYGSEPESFLMVTIGIAALVANVVCLFLISKHKEGEVHMRASWIFSKNDVIANFGIILGGVLVYLLDTRYPDLIIGMIISLIVIRGGIFIIKDARNEKITQIEKSK